MEKMNFTGDRKSNLLHKSIQIDKTGLSHVNKIGQ